MVCRDLSKMPDGKGSDAEMESENEDDGVVSYKQKYRQLKGRLKYLVYEHECFENDIQKAQTKLLQLSRDKSFLLDQLMRYEAVVLSGEEEETDYSSEEEEAPLNSVPSAPPPLPSDLTKSESTDKLDSSDQQATVSLPCSQLTKQGITVLNSTATNSVSRTINTKAGGVRKQPKSSANKVSAIAAAKITKAVARARYQPSALPTSTSPLIVSLPLNIATPKGQNKPPPPPPVPKPVQRPPHLISTTSVSSTAAILASITFPSSTGSGLAGTHSGDKASSLSTSAHAGQQTFQKLSPKLTVAAVSGHTGSKGPTGKLRGGGRAGGAGGRVGGERGRGMATVSPNSSSSSSSSSSDSDESGSESSSSTSSNEGDTAMDTGGPVSIVRSIPLPAGGPQLVRPKAISSPVKVPPQLIPTRDLLTSSSSPPCGPLLSPLTSPASAASVQAARFLWSNRSNSDGAALPAGMGFTPIVPPLHSPTSLSKLSSGSAFQLVTSPPGSAPLHRPPSLQDINITGGGGGGVGGGGGEGTPAMHHPAS